MITDVFKGLDFSLLESPDFKEDSVREEIVLPILHSLGYSVDGLNQIRRSKKLLHPFVNMGSKRRKIYLFPDYLLAVGNKPAWVLDAKAPSEEITTGENAEQAYSYAIHPDVRVRRYALCNGKEFIAFDIATQKPLIYVHLSELGQHWQNLYDLLSPSAFVETRAGSVKRTADARQVFDHAEARPLAEMMDLKKQSAKRHYGVHPYFTKQVWNVVQEYIKNFTAPGDTVLDPYGGSGVTLVEALMLGRKAIHVDLNPLANFIVKTLIMPINIDKLTEEYEVIRRKFERYAPRTQNEVKRALEVYPYPKGVKLPKTSDVPSIEMLFSPTQLAQLAYLKHLIKHVTDERIQATLLLMFSGLLNKINLTYHASSGRSAGRGDSSAMRYYRYRIAPKPAKLDVMAYFHSRLKKVVGAKKEIAPLIDSDTVQNVVIRKTSATHLDFIENETIDYIYTDPPYGSKIQ